MADVWGGVSAMLVAVPSAIAFGVSTFSAAGPGSAAAGALFGILGAVALGLVAPLLGGTPRLITAPCAPAAMVLGALTGDLASRTLMPGAVAPGIDQIVLLVLFVTLIAGVIQLVLGLVGAGQLIKYIPYPVVSGYMSGVGFKILLDQLPKLAALPPGFGAFRALAHLEPHNVAAGLIGLSTVLAMVMAPRITRRAPAPIIALIAGLSVYGVMAVVLPALRSLDANKLVIGRIGGGLEALTSGMGYWRNIGNLDHGMLAATLGTGITLAVLLAIDSLKTCVIVDSITRSRHDSNRELVGQGLGNIAASLFGGMAGAGTSGATLVNLAAGGATRRSGFIAGLASLLALLVLGPLVAWIPRPALAGILVVVGFRMIDRHSLSLLKHKSTHLDFTVILSVTVLAVTAPLLVASACGLGLAVFLFLREQVRMNVIRQRGYADDTFSRRKYIPEDLDAIRRHGRETAICELQGSLFFGTTDQLLSQLEPDIRSCRRIILDMRRVTSIDFTASHLLEQIADRLADKGGELIFSDAAGARPTGRDLQAYLSEVGLARDGSSIRLFPTLNDALEYVEDCALEAEGLMGKGRGDPLSLEEIHLFRGLDAATLDDLRGIIQERLVPSGETICRAGELSDELFLVRKGNVKIVLRLHDGRSHHVASFSRSDFFGDLAFIDREPRVADAIAASTVWLFVFSRAKFDELAVRNPALGHKIFVRLARGLSHRLRQTDAQLGKSEEG